MAIGLDRVRVLGIVERALAPYIGATLATASTKSQCDRLGIVEERISLGQLRQLLDKLEQAMRVFVGPAKASDLMDDVRTTLGARPA